MSRPTRPLPIWFSLFRFLSNNANGCKLYKWACMDKKVIFYKALLQRGKNISHTEKMLYSHLVYKSIVKILGVFEQDGKGINQDELMYQVSQNKWQPLVAINNTRLADELKISRQTVIHAIKHLHETGYLKTNQDGNEEIFMNVDLLSNGFFVLEKIGVISGELLIFYSYLRDKGATFGNCIDTNKERMANDLCVKPLAITKLLNRLYKEGLAKRLENGKLKIY